MIKIDIKWRYGFYLDWIIEKSFSFLLVSLIVVFFINVSKAEINDANLTLIDSTKIDVAISNSAYNRHTGETSYNVTITNISAEPISLPVYLSVEEISSASVIVTNASDTNAAGTPFLIMGSADQTDGLIPGDQLYGNIIFSSSSRERFDFATKAFSSSEQKDFVTIFSNPGDSQLLQVETAAGDVIDVIGVKDDKGFALAVSSVVIRESSSGESGAFFFDSQNRLIDIILENEEELSTLNFNWTTDTSASMTFVSKEGIIEVGEFLLDTPTQVNEFSLNQELIDSKYAEFTNSSAETIYTKSVVNVFDRCGGAISDAKNVNILAREVGGGETLPKKRFYSDGTKSSPNGYNVRLPIVFSNPDPALVDNIFTVVNGTCAVQKPLLKTICAFVPDPAFKFACDILVRSTVDTLCNDIENNPKAFFDTFFETTVNYTPIATINNYREVPGGRITALTSEPPLNFVIQDTAIGSTTETSFPAGTYTGTVTWEVAEGTGPTVNFSVGIDSNGEFESYFLEEGGMQEIGKINYYFPLFEVERINEYTLRYTVSDFTGGLRTNEFTNARINKSCMWQSFGPGPYLVIELISLIPPKLSISLPNLIGPTGIATQ